MLVGHGSLINLYEEIKDEAIQVSVIVSTLLLLTYSLAVHDVRLTLHY